MDICTGWRCGVTFLPQKCFLIKIHKQYTSRVGGSVNHLQFSVLWLYPCERNMLELNMFGTTCFNGIAKTKKWKQIRQNGKTGTTTTTTKSAKSILMLSIDNKNIKTSDTTWILSVSVAFSSWKSLLQQTIQWSQFTNAVVSNACNWSY